MPRSRRCRHRGNGDRSGKGSPPPQPIEGFGERRKLPLRGPCGAPTKMDFGAFYDVLHYFNVLAIGLLQCEIIC